MSSFVTVTLDTTAPVLTFGAHDDAEAGFPFRIGYVLDEGSVLQASLTNASRSLSMDDMGDSLALAIPSDWPDGMATVSATVVDDVGNRETYTVQVPVSGVLPPTPRPPSSFGGSPLALPRRRGHVPERRQLTARTRARARTRTTAIARRDGRSRQVAATAYRADALAQHAHAIPARTHHVLTGQRASITSMSGQVTAIISRRDDPGTEHALLVLGVL